MVMRDDWTALEKLIFLRGSGVVGGAAYETITGNPVSFTAKAAPLRKLQVAFSPVQSLNGYDSPWPAGGGKNLLNPEAVRNENYYINATDGELGIPSATGGTFRCSSYIPVTASTSYFFGFTPYYANLAGCAWYNSEKTYISGSTGYGMSAASMQLPAPPNAAYIRISWRIDEGYDTDWENTVYFGLASDPHEWTPYSNECPISGWSSLHVYDDPLYAGVIEWNQLVDNTKLLTSATSRGVTATGDGNGKILVEGINDGTGQSNFVISTDTDTSFVANHVYFMGGCPANGSDNTYYLYDSDNRIKDYGNGVVYKATAATTFASSLRIRVLEDASAPNKSFAPQILDLTAMFGAEKADEILAMADPASYVRSLFPHDYYAYNAGTETLVGTVNGMDTRSISINIGQTVYSGTLNVLTGVGDDGSFAFVMDGTDMTNCIMSGTSTAGKSRLYMACANAQRPRIKRILSSADVGPIACNEFKSISGDAVYTLNVGISSARNGDGISLYHPDLQTLEAWQAFFAETPMQVVYEVDEPTPISLTPQEVQSLLGENVMWSDANGDLTVEYRSN